VLSAVSQADRQRSYRFHSTGGRLIFKLGTESHSTSKHSELRYSSFARDGNFIHI